tara:strand:+ start:81 stop:569 length:489 start_codon:yes stop_codon:yes gene_type:complete
MFDLKLKTTNTFSFSKLNHALDDIIDKALDITKKTVSERLKKNIDDQNFKPLTPRTKKLRKYPAYNEFYPTLPVKDTTTILKATGKLYDSIKPTEKGVSFNHYGYWHVTGAGNRPLRNWIQGVVGADKGKIKILRGRALKEVQKLIKKSFKIEKQNLIDMKF